MPVCIFNSGNTCFLNALTQCLVSCPGLTIQQLSNSDDELDIFVESVLLDSKSKDIPISLKTSLVQQVFGCCFGHQGQQDPCIFFSEVCAKDGLLAARFESPMTEALHCMDCTSIVSTPHELAENYFHMLKYKTDTKALTVRDLFVENAASESIERYKSEGHMKK